MSKDKLTPEEGSINPSLVCFQLCKYLKTLKTEDGDGVYCGKEGGCPITQLAKSQKQDPLRQAEEKALERGRKEQELYPEKGKSQEVCPECLGKRILKHSSASLEAINKAIKTDAKELWYDCPTCQGTGKAKTDREKIRDILRHPDNYANHPFKMGDITVDDYHLDVDKVLDQITALLPGEEKK